MSQEATKQDILRLAHRLRAVEAKLSELARLREKDRGEVRLNKDRSERNEVRLNAAKKEIVANAAAISQNRQEQIEADTELLQGMTASLGSINSTLEKHKTELTQEVQALKLDRAKWEGAEKAFWIVCAVIGAIASLLQFLDVF